MKRNLLPAALLAAATLLTSCGATSPMLSGMGNQSATTQTTTSSQTSNLVGSGLEKLLGSLLGGSTLNQQSIVGTWNYKSADCVFESENFLLKAGGEVAAAKVEEKVNAALTKLGFTGDQISFTFNTDYTYTATIKGRTIQGTYTLDLENKKMTLTYLNGVGTITPQIALTGNTLSLLYDADKLLKFLTTISAVSNNSTLTSLNTLLQSYDGMLIGMELQK